MTGIYIHIPFCKSRCIYCAFYSTTNGEMRQKYIDAVCHEMKIRSESEAKEQGSKNNVATVYVGGGTPSQLTAPQLRQLFSSLYIIYKVETDAEITVECNPDDVTEELAALLVQLGVNRVSMGAQTFDDTRLRFLRRRHDASQVSLAINRLRKAGIRNISIDLMYGFPNETLNQWKRDIDAALSLNVEHISAYCLMVEEGTALYERIRNGGNADMHECDEDLERQMYYLLIDRLNAAGYEHYEISNFAIPGYRSRHNSSYWTDVPYIGLGAAAHSYDGIHRQWNVSDLNKYIIGIENGTPSFEGETLTDNDRYNDRVMLCLRTCEGLPLDHLSAADRTYLQTAARKYLDEGLLQLADGHLRLTRKGLFVSDMVMSDLMRIS